MGVQHTVHKFVKVSFIKPEVNIVSQIDLRVKGCNGLFNHIKMPERMRKVVNLTSIVVIGLLFFISLLFFIIEISLFFCVAVENVFKIG